MLVTKVLPHDVALLAFDPLWANEPSQRTRSGGEGSSLTRWKASALQRKSQRQLSYDVIYLKSDLKYIIVSHRLVSLNRRRR
ncbi:hypothetical protein PB01_06050 [Psychrobacillus glaciei]|uniref:Uncharacterized protein n=1 Tax=Psychrobacillus glaciei TaxID=2283160 RepID=A0A5J6SL74_9BACI|nr:hypothetical protein PB01_06050 [Psychrobacillus glaciei]